ncbi:Aste57867_17995 [Aphanomyces stellatus]|uniref:Aste57867_17995 protein n=1 Tax=Aphanomyces stellatus TaxID=120398 RepID=A0A485L8W4_9STRA|nr:hypothetical protein As57867_017933 [Aphanomyces stellatus]VFT94734.1 Aste57867_17995 [Aphanomyces stellatus]
MAPPMRLQDLRFDTTRHDLIDLAQHRTKQVTVHTSAFTLGSSSIDRFTLYTLIVTCAATKTWWIIKKRYKQFSSLRRTLLQHLKSSDVNLQLVRNFPFPKKHLRLDTPDIVAERKKAFVEFTSILLAVRSECVFALAKSPAPASSPHLEAIARMIEIFLDVPDRHLTEEVRHASLVLDASPFAAAAAEEPTTTMFTTDESVDPSDVCSICLCSFDDEPTESCLHMSCGHNFHECCVVQWLEKKLTCPLCRHASTQGWMF